MSTGAAVSRILPPREDEGTPVTTSLRVPEKLLERIDKAAKRYGYTRTETMLHFWRWALNELDAEEKDEAEKKAGRK